MKKLILIFLTLVISLTFLSCGKESTLRYSGTIEAKKIDIASKGNGEIIKIYTEEGDKVSEGEPLLKIEHDILNLKLDRAKLAKEVASENYKSAKKMYETTEKNYERIKSLQKKGSVSRNRLDEMENKYVNAKSKYKIAKSKLQKVEKEILILKKQIKDCNVKAPADGVITEKIFEEGELVTGGVNLFTLSDLDNLKVYIYVPEIDLGKLLIGQKVSIISDTYPDKRFKGKIYHIAEEAEFTPKNVQTKEDRVKQVFKVKIRVKNKNDILKSGMPCDVEIDI